MVGTSIPQIHHGTDQLTVSTSFSELSLNKRAEYLLNHTAVLCQICIFLSRFSM